jgi:hypothetical protein
MLSIQWLLWLIFLIAIILYWRNALRVKDRAFLAARKHCLEMEVQLLDESIYLRRFWLKRNEQGRLLFWRAFYFEFTVTGADRYFGRVLMLGNYIQEIQLEPHRLH